MGVPAYNNEDSIVATLTALKKQTYDAIQVLISDDSSQDQTALLCERVAADEARFTFVRQPVNLRYQNFG